MKRPLLLLSLLLLTTTAHAQILVKQSTATTLNFHFTTIADGTDTASPTITGVTLSFIKQSDTLSSGTTNVTAAVSGSVNDCVYIIKGMLNCEVTAANTDTLGRYDAVAAYSGSFSDPLRFQVVPAAVYDWFSGNVGDLSTAEADLDNIQTRLPAALSGGRMDSAANAIATDGISALAVSAAAVVKLQTGLLTLKKNTAFDSLYIKARTSAGVAVTGATRACQLSRDSAALSSTGVSNGVEVGTNGTYGVNFTAGAMNGNSLYLYCTFSGGSGTAVPYEQFIYTQQ